jgi:hypothetical protein
MQALNVVMIFDCRTFINFSFSSWLKNMGEYFINVYKGTQFSFLLQA